MLIYQLLFRFEKKKYIAVETGLYNEFVNEKKSDLIFQTYLSIIE